MKIYVATTGSTEEWNEAYYRLEDYLRAHHLFNKVQQSQIILKMLGRAARRHKTCPSEHPTRLAMEELYDEIERWFNEVLVVQEVPSDRLPSMGKVSMQLLQANETWPNVFLNDQIPPDFRKRMNQISIRSGPDLQISSMVPRAADNSVAVSSDETAVMTSGADRHTVAMMGLIIAALILGVLAAA